MQQSIGPQHLSQTYYIFLVKHFPEFAWLQNKDLPVICIDRNNYACEDLNDLFFIYRQNHNYHDNLCAITTLP